MWISAGFTPKLNKRWDATGNAPSLQKVAFGITPKNMSLDTTKTKNKQKQTKNKQKRKNLFSLHQNKPFYTKMNIYLSNEK